MRPRLLALVSSVVLVATLTAPARAADGAWSPLQEADGHALAVPLGDGTAALISVGGPDDATVFDRRDGAVTEITTVEDAEACRPVDAVTELGNLAVAVECRAKTGLEDPPTRLLELVWAGDDGWVSHLQAEGTLGSIDYSPGGQYVVFTSNSHYGRGHHVTSYHADLGWRDLRRRELGSTGDDLVAAIGDNGNVVALRGAGFEDEPGYWFGGRLVIERYDDTTGVWKQVLDRRYPDGGIDPSRIDVAGGRIAATLVRSRSTGQVNGLADRVVLLTGSPARPRSWSSRQWYRRVLAPTAAITKAGVGVAGWQSVRSGKVAEPWFATWAPQRREPRVWDLDWPTTLTTAAASGRALDLSVSAGGHGVIAYVRHRPGVKHADVAGVSFDVTPDGRLRRQVDTTWTGRAGTTVNVTAGATSASATLGRMERTYHVPPVTRSSVCCEAAR